MKLRQFISFCAIVFVAAFAVAQTSVEVSLPRNVAAGDRFSLTVTVNNPEGRVSDFNAPTLPGCTFLGGPGVSTSSYTSIINGRMQSSKSTGYTFQYRADKEGTVKVPSISVTVDGKSYSTNPGQFTVMPESQSRQNQGGWGSPAPSQRQQGGGSTSSSDFQVGPNDLFMRVALSANNVYEQQAVECSIKLYSINAQVNSLAAASIPAFDGCLIEVIGTPTTIDWHSENVNGRNYYVATIYRALLYPQRAGDITLRGGEYNVRVYRQMMIQDFFTARPHIQEKDLTLKPQATVLHVKSLPEPRPANFSGAVGKFTASSRLIGNTFKTNEASSLIYTIEGTGNIKFLTEPTIDFPSEFEVYDPHVETNAHVSGHNMTGSQTIEYTFVPQSVGKFSIGAHDFVYFDPSKGEYVTESVSGYEINVEKGADVSNVAVSSKSDIQAKNTDIHHIKPGADKPASRPVYLASSILYWCVYPLLMIVASLMLWLILKRRGADVRERRLNRAGKVARKRLSGAGKFLRAKQFEEFYAELLRAMQTYMGDKFMIPASQLNRENIVKALREHGASDETVNDVIRIIDECEMARYTPNLTSENADKIFESARSCINNIENLK